MREHASARREPGGHPRASVLLQLSGIDAGATSKASTLLKHCKPAAWAAAGAAGVRALRAQFPATKGLQIDTASVALAQDCLTGASALIWTLNTECGLLSDVLREADAASASAVAATFARALAAELYSASKAALRKAGVDESAIATAFSGGRVKVYKDSDALPQRTAPAAGGGAAGAPASVAACAPGPTAGAGAAPRSVCFAWPFNGEPARRTGNATVVACPTAHNDCLPAAAMLSVALESVHRGQRAQWDVSSAPPPATVRAMVTDFRGHAARLAAAGNNVGAGTAELARAAQDGEPVTIAAAHAVLSSLGWSLVQITADDPAPATAGAPLVARVHAARHSAVRGEAYVYTAGQAAHAAYRWRRGGIAALQPAGET